MIKEVLAKTEPKALRILENGVKFNKVSHAYLFSGPKGTYKKEMAYHLALMLYCGVDPCYSCDTCKQILDGNHMNVTYIEPMGSTVKKEQILALQDEFSKTSQIDGPRIYIINEADTMTESASNSLLKFIEEPVSDNTVGILITEHEDNILPTIKSRSMVVSFAPLNKRQIEEELKSSGIETKVASILSYLVSNVNEANSLLEDESFNSSMSCFNDYVELIKEGKSVSLFYRDKKSILTKDKKENRGKTIKMFLSLLEGLYRDLIEAYIHGDNYNFSYLKDEALNIAEHDSVETLTEKLKEILEVEKRLPYSINLDPNMDLLMFNLNGGEF